MAENIFLTNKQKIDQYAYYDNQEITELIIPEGITHIEQRAFSNCKNLKKIILPESLIYIGDSAFSNCLNLEEINLPKNINHIGYRAFADCTKIKEISIPENIDELSWGTFSGCYGLEKVILPNNIKDLGQQTFLNCKNLKYIKIPENIKEIPDQCFMGCIKLNINIPSRITKLGNKAFENCYKLEFFPKDVHQFGDNCFKNCKSLKIVNINKETTYLSDGLFDGCIRLQEINYNGDKLLKIGKKCFRNCISLKTIPNFIANYNEKAFENCNSLENINIIYPTIPYACFRNCKNLKIITNQNNFHNISTAAFSGCTNLEEMDLTNLSYIHKEAFMNCKKLKKVQLGLNLRMIDSKAFLNCYNLSDIELPDSIEIINKEVFKNCHSIKQITIPANLKSFGDAAFSFMDSLETIDVSPYNKIFMTPDHKILINQMQQKLLLYASGCKDKTYSLKDYNVETDMLEHELIKPLTHIGEYAFAGAKNLEELTVCGCTNVIDASAFIGCNNLKKLNVLAISLFTCPGFKITDHGKYYFKENSKIPCYIPFETVTFGGNLVQIFPDALQNFSNVKTLILPKEKKYSISTNAFADCSLLEQVNVPKQVDTIDENAFPANTKLIFENGLEINNLIDLKNNNIYDKYYKLYTLNNGTYYIEQDNKITTITQEYIKNICSHPNELYKNPVLFLEFMNDLIKHDLAIKPLFNGILISNISLLNRNILFQNLKKDDELFLKIIDKSKLLEDDDNDTKYLLADDNLSKLVEYVNIFKKYNIDNTLFYDKKLIANLNPKSFERMIQNDFELLTKIIVNTRLLEGEQIVLKLSDNNLENHQSYYLTYKSLESNNLELFMKEIKKYNIKDKFLYKKSLIPLSNNPLFENLLKLYDANIKRLLINSLTIDDNISSPQNVKDLLNLMKITGALEKDPITRQRACTFITEKIFDEYLPNGTKNEYRIVSDDIHRIYNFPYTRDEFDEEFANFFLENYQELLEEEQIRSGFIQRVYLNFRQISETCTSNKGSQRKLKVTIEKCKNYLSTVKFDNVTEDNKDFAKFLSAWYDNNSVWINAQKILLESLEAPRNIFTKFEKDEEDNIIYDNDPKHDLKEELNQNYSFEWLPKQDYENLVLGKYCNCCAHIEGAGRGIMRASMILDNCQNLVIRNESGKIISKTTIYVNKEKGYAVFNNVETSLKYRTSKDLEKIYEAFLRGAETFINTYNKNNQSCPIKNINIGSNRNTILEYLTDDKHPVVEVQQAIKYGNYSLSGSGYNGDWSIKQRLVLKR